jgi:hypothetical protein
MGLIPKTHLYPPYQPRSAIDSTLSLGGVGLAAGTFSACVKNALFARTTSAWGVLTIYGATIPIYGMCSIDSLMAGAAFGAYGFVKTFMSNWRHTNDGWNEFGGGASGAFIWTVFRRQPAVNVVFTSLFAGAGFGMFNFLGRTGGLGSILGVNLDDALSYRRQWRFYPTNLIPLEDYERALGRKTTIDDFRDINEAIGENAVKEMPTDVVGIPPIAKVDNSWWKDTLAKAREQNKDAK